MDIELLSKNKSLGWLSKNKIVFQSERYLEINLSQSLRKAFTRLRFKLLDSMTKHGRFLQLPYHERMCICRASASEDITHILFDFELYSTARQNHPSCWGKQPIGM